MTAVGEDKTSNAQSTQLYDIDNSLTFKEIFLSH